MIDTMNVQLGQRGIITLPKPLQENYNLRAGDDFTLLNLDGVLVLAPGRSQIDSLAEQITQSFVDEGESIESMLFALREER